MFFNQLLDFRDIQFFSLVQNFDGQNFRPLLFQNSRKKSIEDVLHDLKCRLAVVGEVRQALEFEPVSEESHRDYGGFIQRIHSVLFQHGLLFRFNVQHFHFRHDFCHRNLGFELIPDSVHGVLKTNVVGFHRFKQLSHVLLRRLITSAFCCAFPLETVVGEESLHLFVFEAKRFVLVENANVVFPVFFFDDSAEDSNFVV